MVRRRSQSDVNVSGFRIQTASNAEQGLRFAATLETRRRLGKTEAFFPEVGLYIGLVCPPKHYAAAPINLDSLSGMAAIFVVIYRPEHQSRILRTSVSLVNQKRLSLGLLQFTTSGLY